MLLGALSFAAMSSLAHACSELRNGHVVDWQVIAMVRTFLAMIFAAGLATASGARLVFFKPPVLWVRSIAGSCALISGFYSITHMHVGESLTLTNMFPIWVALLSWPLIGVRPTGDVWGAVVCGVLGVALIQQPRIAEGNYVWVVALASSMFSSVALLGLHKLQHLDARAVVTHFSAVSLMFSVAAAFIFPRAPNAIYVFDLRLVLMLLAMGITATLGQILLTKAFAAGDPAKVSVVGLSQVAFGVLFDIFLWGRHYNWMASVGILLVVAPSAWLMLRRKQK